ncbi:hypothetical protein C0V82_10805 [Niveispirillum cyanobacteriorum]|uniref:Uncharacterized protein n=1 Tax=Niveispirillum cyanobacteriorum TaxID=1612173 RepID=A0A2K9NC70_9PROT|nr:hypothetical protein C0V82_10805 [Niveispirillum cyanobacteriorum]GGE52417.1 hypothetical protein GCM10011317_08300 [Niveispirillum cyanobacteriorum]
MILFWIGATALTKQNPRWFARRGFCFWALAFEARIRACEVLIEAPLFVIPAEAGTQGHTKDLDAASIIAAERLVAGPLGPGFHRDDEGRGDFGQCISALATRNPRDGRHQARLYRRVSLRDCHGMAEAPNAKGRPEAAFGALS